MCLSPVILRVLGGDGLCSLSTGGGFAARQLYTDSDEALFEGQRPIVLNGIEELASRTDLVDRSIVLELPLIEQYEPERAFWKRFEEAHSRLLGALLDVIVDALNVRWSEHSGTVSHSDCHISSQMVMRHVESGTTTSITAIVK